MTCGKEYWRELEEYVCCAARQEILCETRPSPRPAKLVLENSSRLRRVRHIERQPPILYDRGASLPPDLRFTHSPLPLSRPHRRRPRPRWSPRAGPPDDSSHRSRLLLPSRAQPSPHRRTTRSRSWATRASPRSRCVNPPVWHSGARPGQMRGPVSGRCATTATGDGRVVLLGARVAGSSASRRGRPRS